MEQLHFTREEVLATYRKLRKEGERVASKYRATALMIESFLSGNPWSVVVSKDGGIGVDSNAWFDRNNEDVPRTQKNVLTPVWLTWSSLLSKDRPSVQAVAASEEPEDTYRSALAQKVIDYVSDTVNSATLVHQTVQFTGMCGMAGIKAIVNPESQQVEWAVQTIHDFVLDPHSPDHRQARWVIFTGHCSEDEALDLYEAHDVVAEPQTKKYMNGSNEELEGCEMAELWLKPTRKFKHGLYACIVGDEVVEFMDYPEAYVIKRDDGTLDYRLPLCLMKCRAQRDSVYGLTPFEAAVNSQRSLNESLSRITKFIRTTSNVHLKIPQSLSGTFNPAQQNIIEFPDTDAGIKAAAQIGFTEPPQLPSQFIVMRDYWETGIPDVVGLNKPTLGDTKASMSGVAIEHVVQLDQEKNADVTKSMEDMVQDLYRLSLQLIRVHYDTPRMMRITDGDTVDVQEFVGADLDGVDIRLQPASEIDQLAYSKKAAAKEQVDQGLATPLDLQKAENDAGYGLSKRVAEDAIQRYLGGEDIALQPGDINLDVLKDVVAKHKARAMRARDMHRWVQLDQFLREVSDLEGRQDNARPVDGKADQVQQDAGGAQ